MFKNLNIGTKLRIAFLLTAVISIAAVSYYGYSEAKKELRNQITGELLLVASIKEREVLDFFEHVQGRATDFSSDGFIRDDTEKIIYGNTGATGELSNYLIKNKMPLDTTLDGIEIADSNGKIISSTDQQEIGISEAGHNYFTAAKGLAYGDSYVGDVAISHHFEKDKIIFPVSSPLFSRNTGKIIGVLINYVKIDEFSGVVSGSQLLGLGEPPEPLTEKTANFEIYLVNKDGLMITESKFSKDVILKQKVNVDLVKNCAKGEEGNGTYNDYRGVSVIGASVCFDNGWTLLVEVEENTAFKAITDIQKTVFIFALLLIAALFVLVYFLVKGITRPIKNLTSAAGKIGGGDLSFRAKKETGDEIGKLAEDFNIMAAKLEESYKGLEGKVKERTADLQKFKLAVENASDHIIITDADGAILYANKAAEAVTGYSAQEMVGQKSSLWGRQMNLDYYKNLWHTLKTDKKIFSGEITNKKKNGKKYTAFISIAPILDENNEVSFFVGIERDVTKEKEIDRAKSEFVSLASHQLRTPLSVIGWYAEMMLKEDIGKMTKKQKEYMSEIYSANQGMVDLVNAFLNVSRIELGTLRIEAKSVRLPEIIEGILKELLPAIKRKKVKIIKNYKDNFPPVETDLNIVQISLQNLISNAVKYNKTAGKVEIKISKRKSDILVSVSDTGYGIPKDSQAKIFGKMYRAENIRQIDPDGNGLGLYTAKSMLNYIGGEIWFKSKENEGTTFYITIPAANKK